TPFAGPGIDQFCLQTPAAIVAGKVRRASCSRKQEVLAGGEMFVVRVLLRHVTDMMLQGVEILIKRLAVKQDVTAGGLKLVGQHSHERALSTTARAHHADEFATRDAKGDSLEANLALAKAVRDFVCLKSANDIALFL